MLRRDRRFSTQHLQRAVADYLILSVAPET
jgi:hypothetical protein